MDADTLRNGKHPLQYQSAQVFKSRQSSNYTLHAHIRESFWQASNSLNCSREYSKQWESLTYSVSMRPLSKCISFSSVCSSPQAAKLWGTQTLICVGGFVRVPRETMDKKGGLAQSDMLVPCEENPMLKQRASPAQKPGTWCLKFVVHLLTWQRFPCGFPYSKQRKACPTPLEQHSCGVINLANPWFVTLSNQPWVRTWPACPSPILRFTQTCFPLCTKYKGTKSHETPHGVNPSVAPSSSPAALSP